MTQEWRLGFSIRITKKQQRLTMSSFWVRCPAELEEQFDAKLARKILLAWSLVKATGKLSENNVLVQLTREGSLQGPFLFALDTKDLEALAGRVTESEVTSLGFTQHHSIDAWTGKTSRIN